MRGGHWHACFGVRTQTHEESIILTSDLQMEHRKDWQGLPKYDGGGRGKVAARADTNVGGLTATLECQ
jgi:hypothetical protein